MQIFGCQSSYIGTSFSVSCIIRFKEILLISGNPLSKIKHYDIKIEFEVRDSPHVHSFLWVLHQSALSEWIIDSFIEYLDSVFCANLPYKEQDLEFFNLVKISDTFALPHLQKK